MRVQSTIHKTGHNNLHRLTGWNYGSEGTHIELAAGQYIIESIKDLNLACETLLGE